MSHLSLFGRLPWPFLVPAKTASANARRRGRGRPFGRRAKRAFLDGDEHGGTLPNAGIATRTSRAQRAAVLVSVVLLGAANVVAEPAQAAEVVVEAAGPGAAIESASARFGVPVAWIRAVIAVESGGDPAAVSPKGAMGLMQLMPATWDQMRRDLALGKDPLDRRDNVVAGVAYLRQLYDRFGASGAFAAYNAGPGRYAEHLATTRPLPAETRAYVAAIHRRLGWSEAGSEQDLVQPTSDWRVSPLFPPLISGDFKERRQ